MEKNDAAIFLLTTPELFENFEEDIRFAEKLGKKVYVCASGDGSFDMPDRLQLTAWLGDLQVKWLATTKEGFAYDQDLQKAVDRGRDVTNGTLRQKLAHGMTIFSIAVTWPWMPLSPPVPWVTTPRRCVTRWAIPGTM